MTTQTSHPVHGDIIHFFDGESADPKVRSALVLSTVVGETLGTYDVVYLPMHDGMTPRMFTARHTDTFPHVGHINREGMHLLLDPKQWA